MEEYELIEKVIFSMFDAWLKICRWIDTSTLINSW